ncbi:aggregation-promoting factor C-terminal-like domain-containing protein [Bifidobacterium choladohabitans]|uniref:aggregation-promoting factor C-terminal-like domain-containing protein n=1 Tax=Bifidobacterium choladohabitans TaxID=2750947 RepID=UPI0018DCCC6F|nr:G5 domain-containing protein [Bifidobacterium choladohabitans]MBI0047889.1 G5 domain-containing protein [Bifidobacterium choladohabitans]
MARRWTPRRFVVLRRIRVVSCALLVVLATVLTFGIAARKSVALSVNGQTRMVTTYAYSVDGLLRERGIKVKTHDLVDSTSGGQLRNHAAVTVRSAYQTTIVIQGQRVPFWTTATSMDQLLGFFEENRKQAMKVTVDVDNVYNQLTGGLVINQTGPVTVIADGKTSVAPDGKLPAASILDSKGIVLGKEDRVSVEHDQGTTVLRVQRVTHGNTQKTIPIPFATRTVVDPSLAPGQTQMRQAGVAGRRLQTIQVTYVDGQAESEQVIKEETVAIPVDQVVAVGPDKPKEGQNSGQQSKDTGKDSQQAQKTPSPSPSPSKDSQSATTPSPAPTQTKPPQTTQPAQPSKPDKPTTSSKPEDKPAPSPAPNPSPNGLWHASVDLAQTYAGGAAAQRGWTGSEFTALVELWNRESGWLWYAENKNSGAYGIPQAYPGSKMALFGANWHDDAAVQIDWGLYYIAQRYGNPSTALQYQKRHNSY